MPGAKYTVIDKQVMSAGSCKVHEKKKGVQRPELGGPGSRKEESGV